MSEISIRSEGGQEVILLSNRFIDEYMPKANGEFVKIYLYLLRTLSGNLALFSLAKAADLLNCTEGDILRALKYWAKEGLLILDLNEKNEVQEITLLPVSASLKKEVVPAQSVEKSKKEELAFPETKEDEAGKEYPPIVIGRKKREELSQNEEIQQLLFLSEKYMGRTLTPSSIDRLMYFYDTLKFSVDLVEYLVEYCVSGGHGNMRYIETVAFAWARKGISTVEEAKSEASHFNQEYYAILKALGIGGRNPTEVEIQYMDTWKKEYGFSLDIILEACSRTILKTAKPSFQYAEGILSDWNKNGVRKMSDIEHLDLAHQRGKAQTTQPKKLVETRFHNFNQRTYDFDEYEKKLLGQAGEIL